MKKRDLVKKLQDAGFKKIRDVGDHAIYFKRGKPPIPVPRGNEINEYTAQGILKDAGLK